MLTIEPPTAKFEPSKSLGSRLSTESCVAFLISFVVALTITPCVSFLSVTEAASRDARASFIEAAKESTLDCSLIFKPYLTAATLWSRIVSVTDE